MSPREDIAIADLLGHVPLRRAVALGLLAKLRTPGRHYHGRGHIAELWTTHRRLSRGSVLRRSRPEALIAASLLCHDVVCDPRRADNEPASAACWRRCARIAGRLPRRDVERVAATIEATAHHARAEPPIVGQDALLLWVADLDLAPLGDTAQRFAFNSRRLRAEALCLSAEEWRKRTSGFLAALNRRRSLYHTARMRRRFEAAARANIARALQRLG
jgi:predicted metal-dependent HD superfamily phosphohydrolase